MATLTTRLAAVVAVSVTLLATSAPSADTSRLSFTPSGKEFTFDTGVLRGKLRPQGKSLGLASVIHIPSGVMLDQGDQGYGLFSHYRVFTTGQRYGHGAWDWPSTARMREDGAVEINFASDTNRPFDFRAVYHWAAPDTLDLETTVFARQDLRGFESFLASYFAARFTNALAYVNEPPAKTGQPDFMAAEKSLGTWQMFPRDAAAVALVNDGRWQLEPHPVQWSTMPALARPIGVRRDPVSGVSVALMGRAEDCFAVLMPYQTEGHYSLYLSLLGRDLKAGQTATARTRLLVLTTFSEGKILESWKALATSNSDKQR
jgi:hypothetical protein